VSLDLSSRSPRVGLDHLQDDLFCSRATEPHVESQELAHEHVRGDDDGREPALSGCAPQANEQRLEDPARPIAVVVPASVGEVADRGDAVLLGEHAQNRRSVGLVVVEHVGDGLWNAADGSRVAAWFLAHRPPSVRRGEQLVLGVKAREERLFGDERVGGDLAPDLEDRTDVLSLLLRARDEDDEPMTDVELRDELMTLLLAGHETTATGLAFAFDLLLRNPHVLHRLREELTGGDDTYLDAVVTETLRLRPVIDANARTLTEPRTIGGWDLPAGIRVYPAIAVVHLREDLYPQPHEFRPERFIDGEAESYAWLPFGGGIRRCIGASLAQAEIAEVIRTVVSSVDLQPARPDPERVVMRGITLVPQHGMQVIVGSAIGKDAAPYPHRRPLGEIVKNYNRVAPLYSTLEPLYLIFPSARRKAVAALNLKAGDVVLEIGAGTGRNLPHLVDAVGPNGTVIAVDASDGMLAQAHKLIERHGWSNVQLLHQDVAQLEVDRDLDGVLFSLSYSCIPDPRPAVAEAWKRLRPSARVVVMDMGLTNSKLSRVLDPIANLLIKLAPGDAYSRPWDDLAGYGPVATEHFLLGLYYVCTVRKPGTSNIGRA
jgi:cytochrome P450/ubiquinone/menaquinone biosynthesis C-methylase UbiE